MALRIKTILEAIPGTWGNQSIIAQKCGCCRKTIYNKIQNSKKLQNAIEEAKHIRNDRIEYKYQLAVEENNIAAILWGMKYLVGYGKEIDLNLKNKYFDLLADKLKGMSDNELRSQLTDIRHRKFIALPTGTDTSD